MKILGSSGGATPRAITNFERKHGVLLPVTFRSFLLNYDGGVPSPSYFTSRNGFTANLAQILSITSGTDRHLIYFQYCIEDGLIPIGLNGGGDYFFLEIETGAIFYWQHEIHDLRFTSGDLFFLAASISELLSGLEGEEKPEPGEIEQIGKSGDAKMLNQFLETHPINETNEAGRTVAKEAARYGNLEVLKECIRHGAQTKNLLHYAVNNKTTSIIEYLLALGLDINELNEKDQTPLSRAVVYDEIRDFLIERGAVE